MLYNICMKKQTHDLILVGNVYIDINVFGVETGSQDGDFKLEGGTDYSASRVERVIGGSAVNAAMQAKRLGLDVAFVGKVGRDETGEEVRALLEERGISSQLISESADASTAETVNLIGQDGQFVGVHYGNASKQLSPEDFDLDHELFTHSQAVYFGGTAKQPHLLAGGEKLFKDIRDRGLKIFYDPNRFPAQDEARNRQLILKQMCYVDGYFPNQQELLQLTDHELVDQALEAILKKGVGFVALKLGAKGCRVKTKQDDFTVDGLDVKPITTVGAGDCFNATFITYYLKGEPLKRCAELANIAAAIKVEQNVWPDEAMIVKKDSQTGRD